MGSPLSPPDARSPSPEFHTPPIEDCLIDDTVTAPSLPALVLVPPPAPEPPIPFSDAENIPPTCYANPSAPRAPLQPIEEVVSDAEDSDVVVERSEDQIGETAFSFTSGSNQGRGACHRAVHALACHPAPYPHRMQENIIPSEEHLSSRENSSNNKETIVMTSEEEAMSAPVRNPPGVRTVSFLTDHQLEPGIRALQAAQFLDQEPTFWLMQGLISTDSFTPGLEYWERDVDLGPEYDEVVE